MAKSTAAANANKGKKDCPLCGKKIAARAMKCKWPPCTWKATEKAWSPEVRTLARKLVHASIKEGQIFELIPLIRKEGAKLGKLVRQLEDADEDLIKFLVDAAKKT